MQRDHDERFDLLGSAILFEYAFERAADPYNSFGYILGKGNSNIKPTT